MKSKQSEVPMTIRELDAYGRIAHAIALVVFEFMESERSLPTTNEMNLPSPYFYTYSTSVFELSAEILWKLKILKSLYRDNRFASFFKFTCDLADVPTIAVRNAASGLSFEKVLWGFVYLRSEYSRMHLDRATLFLLNGEPKFSIREDERGLFQALEALGFVDATPTGYSSSSKLETLIAGMSIADI
jgi:hypothetical protein